MHVLPSQRTRYMSLNEPKPSLYVSPVMFNDVAHTYALGCKRLSGVTQLLHRTLFADKYKGVSQAVLNKAADYGHNIHEQIELVDALGVTSSSPAVQAYLEMKAAMSLTTIANEYLVSDEDYVASSIDIVFHDFTLADIKTTSQLDMAYLSWQLSMYAYLFEKQNPQYKVPRLLAIWLPKPRYGKPMVVEVPRKSSDALKVIIAWGKSLTIKTNNNINITN